MKWFCWSLGSHQTSCRTVCTLPLIFLLKCTSLNKQVVWTIVINIRPYDFISVDAYLSYQVSQLTFAKLERMKLLQC